MRDHYYGLGDGNSWAVTSDTKDDPNPPIVIFESTGLAEHYRRIVDIDNEWEVMPIGLEELEYHAQNSGDRFWLCTTIDDGRIWKVELSLSGLAQYDAQKN